MRFHLLIPLLISIWLWLGAAIAYEASWRKYNQAGIAAYRQGNYAEAVKQFEAALKEAKGFGEDDVRLATSLNNLAELYRVQGQYAKAEPLYKRSLAIREKALGPEHPDVAQSLNNLAELYRTQGKYAEAGKLEARAKAIWASHEQKNPAK